MKAFYSVIDLIFKNNILYTKSSLIQVKKETTHLVCGVNANPELYM